MKEQLVEMTGLSPRVIRVWFQNKRCKDKKVQNKLMEKQMHREAVSVCGRKMRICGEGERICFILQLCLLFVPLLRLVVAFALLLGLLSLAKQKRLAMLSEAAAAAAASLSTYLALRADRIHRHETKYENQRSSKNSNSIVHKCYWGGDKLKDRFLNVQHMRTYSMHLIDRSSTRDEVERKDVQFRRAAALDAYLKCGRRRWMEKSRS